MPTSTTLRTTSREYVEETLLPQAKDLTKNHGLDSRDLVGCIVEPMDQSGAFYLGLRPRNVSYNLDTQTVCDTEIYIWTVELEEFTCHSQTCSFDKERNIWCRYPD